jgi:hypothetical protein
MTDAGSTPPDALEALGSGGTARWEFLEILAVVILAAESLRVVGSVIAGIVNAASTHTAVYGEQRLVGSAMERAANFSDGPGIVLLLISVGLLWWRAEYWTARITRTTGGLHDGGLPAEAVQALRLQTLARWASVLFTLAALGAIAFLLGDILVNTAGGVSSASQAQSYANDTFSFAYLVIGSVGVVASVKLSKLCVRDVVKVNAAASTDG